MKPSDLPRKDRDNMAPGVATVFDALDIDVPDEWKGIAWYNHITERVTLEFTGPRHQLVFAYVSLKSEDADVQLFTSHAQKDGAAQEGQTR